MKKNIFIGLLTALLISSITFGYYQKERADKQENRAIENERIVKEALDQVKILEKETEMQKKIAIASAKRVAELKELALKNQ